MDALNLDQATNLLNKVSWTIHRLERAVAYGDDYASRALVSQLADVLRILFDIQGDHGNADIEILFTARRRLEAITSGSREVAAA